jgi:formate-dependent nitrite reductase cytochrome c552 subunit
MGHLRTPTLMVLALVVVVGLAKWGVPLAFSSGAGPEPVKLALGVGGRLDSQEDAKRWADTAPQLAGATACAACHGSIASTLSSGDHSGVTCQNCHVGSAQGHVENRATLGIDRSRALCIRCHGKVVGRPADFPQVVPEKHAGEAVCADCHSPHSPGFGAAPAAGSSPTAGPATAPTQAAPGTGGTPSVSHEVAGRSDCLLCHGAGRLEPVPATHAGRPNDTCLLCHKSK